MIDQPDVRALLSLLENEQRHNPDDDLVRRAVRLRANDVCEYCLRRTSNLFHIDHIMPSALWQRYLAGRIAAVAPVSGRRGPDHIDNFAWCCPLCNGHKAQQVFARVRRQNHRLFDPRRDRWPEHFGFLSHYIAISGKTPVGLATERALALNGGGLDGPLVTRHDEILDGFYPPEWARGWTI